MAYIAVVEDTQHLFRTLDVPLRALPVGRKSVGDVVGQDPLAVHAPDGARAAPGLDPRRVVQEAAKPISCNVAAASALRWPPPQ